MINLLPDYEKEQLRNDYHYRLIVVVLFFLLLIVFVANLLLVPSFILSSAKLSITQGQAQKLKESPVGKEKGKYEDTVRQTNSRVAFLARNDGGHVSASYVAKNITATLGQHVRLSNIMYQKNKDSEEVKIQGLAENRSDLIAFKERLNGLKLFSQVVLPVSSLVADTNINFSMQLTVDPHATMKTEEKKETGAETAKTQSSAKGTAQGKATGTTTSTTSKSVTVSGTSTATTTDSATPGVGTTSKAKTT